MAGPCSLLDVLHGLDAICEHLHWRKVAYRVSSRGKLFAAVSERLDRAPKKVRECVLRIARASEDVIRKAATHIYVEPLLKLRRTDILLPQAVVLMISICNGGGVQHGFPAMFDALAKVDLSDARPERFVLLAMVCLREIGLRNNDAQQESGSPNTTIYSAGAFYKIPSHTSLDEALESVWVCAHESLNRCVQARVTLCDLRDELLKRGLISCSAPKVRPEPHAFEDGFFTASQRAHLAPAPDVSMFFEPHILFGEQQTLCV